MRSMRWRSFIRATAVALFIGLGALPLYGQGPRLPASFPRSDVSRSPRWFASLPDSTPHKQTYWAEGGVIGALGGVALAQLVNGLCEGNCGGNQRVFLMAVGGFVIGALVGGGIEKEP